MKRLYNFLSAKDEGWYPGYIDIPVVPKDIWENPNQNFFPARYIKLIGSFRHVLRFKKVEL